MSALDELKKKDGYTALEWAVVELSNQDSALGLNCKNWYEEAADELAEKNAELLALRERVAKLELAIINALNPGEPKALEILEAALKSQ